MKIILQNYVEYVLYADCCCSKSIYIHNWIIYLLSPEWEREREREKDIPNEIISLHWKKRQNDHTNKKFCVYYYYIEQNQIEHWASTPENVILKLKKATIFPWNYFKLNLKFTSHQTDKSRKNSFLIPKSRMLLTPTQLGMHS